MKKNEVVALPPVTKKQPALAWENSRADAIAFNSIGSSRGLPLRLSRLDHKRFTVQRTAPRAPISSHAQLAGAPLLGLPTVPGLSTRQPSAISSLGTWVCP